MKPISTTALAVALALGAVTLTGPAVAQKKEKEAKGPNYKLSKPVQAAAGAAQTALAAGDNATAAAKLAEAKAAAKTDDDRYIVASLSYDLSRKTNDQKMQDEALEGLLASTRITPEQRAQILLGSGQKAYQTGNYALAEQRLNEAVQLNPSDTNAYALLAETRFKAGKPAEAVAMFQQASARAKQSGTKLPADWYGRAMSIAYSAKLPAQAHTLSQEWLVAYPTKDNWRDSLTIWRDLNKPDAETQLDLYRLSRSAGALKGQADYMEYVDSVYLRNPGEAKAVLDEGVRAGFVNLTASQNAREIDKSVSGRITADKASLAKSEADAKGAKGTAKLALNTGDAYLGYSNWAKAAEMYRLALTKGGVDANLVNTRLGMALARSGDKEGAKAAFAAVTGPRAALASYWTIWIDQGAAPAAA